MNFKISRSLLFQSLTHFQSVVEKRNTIPILSNIKISARKNLIRLIATDLSIQLSEEIVAEVTNEGEVTLPSQMIFDIIRKVPENTQIEVKKNDNDGKVFIFFNSSKFSLPYLPATDYPEIESEQSLHTFKIGSEKLRYLINDCKFSMGVDESRPYLNGVYMHSNENEIITVATDGHRLSKCSVKNESDNNGFDGVIIPKKTVNEIAKLLDEVDKNVVVEISRTKVQFTINNIQLISKLVNANFPDYETVIPGNNNLIVKCHTKAFAETIDRVSTISSEKFRTVKLQIQNNKCTVSSFGEEKSAGTEEIDVIYDGKNININFNARYLLEVLSIITSEKIKICFADNTAPTVLEGDTEDNNSLYLIMQMRA